MISIRLVGPFLLLALLNARASCQSLPATAAAPAVKMAQTPEVLADSSFRKGDRRLLAFTDSSGTVVPGLEDLALEMNPSTDLRVLPPAEVAALLGVAVSSLDSSASRYNKEMVRLWLDDAVNH